MSDIRPLDLQDVPHVASMFMRVLRKESAPPSSGLVDYLSRIFLEPPGHDPEIVSQVHVRDDGSVSGFIGVIPLALTLEDRPLRAAIASTYMVEDHENDPFAGARLLRRFLAGPQDISLTETANDISTTMWRKMRGTVLSDYSLEWLRVIRPAAFMIEAAARATRIARLASPLARPFDALIRRSPDEAAWSHLSPAVHGNRLLPGADIDDDEAAWLLRHFSSDFPMRPAWKEEDLAAMVAHSHSKPNYGSMVRRKVSSRSGSPVGMFLYYGDKARIGRTIQILAAPGHEGAVIDAMLADADQRGLAALRGRTQPALLNAMLGRRFSFVHSASSIVHARDASLVTPFRSGQAFFNGFAGESWTRLIGGRFD